VQGVGLFACPGYGEGAYEYGHTGHEYAGYGFNYYASQEKGSTTRYQLWTKFHQLDKTKILMCDGYKQIATGLTVPVSSYA